MVEVEWATTSIITDQINILHKLVVRFTRPCRNVLFGNIHTGPKPGQGSEGIVLVPVPVQVAKCE